MVHRDFFCPILRCILTVRGNRLYVHTGHGLLVRISGVCVVVCRFGRLYMLTLLHSPFVSLGASLRSTWRKYNVVGNFVSSFASLGSHFPVLSHSAYTPILVKPL